MDLYSDIENVSQTELIEWNYTSGKTFLKLIYFLSLNEHYKATNIVKFF